MKTILIPIGIDCSVTHYLRNSKKRVQAFPFDWNVTPVSSAISLIQNGFVDFMAKENLLFLPPTDRMLFKENGIDLEVSHEIITPVLDKKYKILFPHDFSAKGEEDLGLVKEKYQRRICRLKQILEQSDKVTFVYNLRKPNDWQLAQYEISGVHFLLDNIEDLYRDFEALIRHFNNIEFMSLMSLQST